jgi:hypothetical protein
MHSTTDTSEGTSVSQGLASSPQGKSGKFYERAGLRQVSNLVESLACVLALLLVCTPLQVYLVAEDMLNDPRLEMWFSIEVLLGMTFLHWRLKRFLIPLRGELRDELRASSEKQKANRKPFWTVGPAGLFFLGYSHIGMAVFFTLTSQALASEVPDAAIRLYRNNFSIAAFTLQPLFLVIAGVMWQARWANRFLVERCEKLQATPHPEE